MRYTNLDELLHAEKMKKLRHVVLHGLCDNQMLSILGQGCTTLQYLDITGSTDVTDLGIQNLVFPLSIQKAGRAAHADTTVETNARSARVGSPLQATAFGHRDKERSDPRREIPRSDYLAQPSMREVFKCLCLVQQETCSHIADLRVGVLMATFASRYNGIRGMPEEELTCPSIVLQAGCGGRRIGRSEMPES